MNWGRNLRLSVQALGRSRARTLLSATSMAIGITAVVLLFGVGAGAERAFTAALENMGKNLLAVDNERRESGALRGQSRRFQVLTLEDWRALNEDLASVERAAPIALRSSRLSYAGESFTATLMGTTPEFRHTNNQQPVAGRFLDILDIDDHARVAVIGARVVDELFFGEQPLGERLLVDGAPYMVIGVLEEKGLDVTGAPQDDRILIPISTALRRVLNRYYIDRIFVQAVSNEQVGTAQAAVESLLRARHGLRAGEPSDFTVRDQAGMVETIRRTDETLSRFLAGIATLSLGLASLGLLAVTWLSVHERHGEIGLRLAVGALPCHVLVQFLSEAVLIALLGAGVGLLLGGSGIILGQWLLGWQLVLDPVDVGYVFVLSLCLSLLFGAFPALHAARLDPIEVLRSA